ncbi:MAG: DNA polymerase III subunit epsilon [Oceanospirillaceae bacterium]|nr:DNA polymerase III subunit epsilon [Oceanospirillaceae bacterium]
MLARQKLLGYGLLIGGGTLFGGLFLGLWLTAELLPQGQSHWGVWLLALAPGALVTLLYLLLDRRLFTPLRHLQIQLARLAANPDARSDFPPEGWLKPLGADLDRIRDGWREDRVHIDEAAAAGARQAERTSAELEAVLRAVQTPLLLCDRHQRLLLFNEAAEQLFADVAALGLGRRLSELLPMSSLKDALAQLSVNAAPRQLLLPWHGRWLRLDLRRVGGNCGEALIALEDSTSAQEADQRWYAPLAHLLPELRGHGSSLIISSEALTSGKVEPLMRQRLEQVLREESLTLGRLIEALSEQVEGLQRDPGRLEDTWSNDLWSALGERLGSDGPQLVAIGIPAWLRADGPSLLELLFRLLGLLRELTGESRYEAEVQLGNQRVYLDLIWRGSPIDQGRLEQWRWLPLAESTQHPQLNDILRRHDSDWWSLADTDGHARLRLPLAAATRIGAPPPPRPPRPEFHDFSIADLPAPDAEQGRVPLRSLEMIVFDTETTGLDLRRGDCLISIGACRILNGRLLASDVFDQLVNPERPIPPESTRIHGLSDDDVAGAPPAEVVLPRFRDFIGHGVLVAHNASFDLRAIQPGAEGAGISLDMPVLDTLLLSRALDPTLEGHGLDALAERYQLVFVPGSRHTALGDARVTAELLLQLLPRLEARGVHTLDDAVAFQTSAAQRSTVS